MAVLSGFISPAFTPQGVYDTYYLVDDLNEHDWIGYPFYASQATAITGRAIAATHLPISIANRAVNAFFKTHYFYDYYLRIHIRPKTLNLSLIVSDQSHDVEVWNAFLVGKLLTSITEIGTDGLILTQPVSLPYTYTPNQSKIYTVSISTVGNPTINALYTFNFPQAVSLTITGIRVVVWPFLPIFPYNETREYLTDVIACKSAEQRLALRTEPRETTEYKYILNTPSMFSLAKSIAKFYSPTGIAAPSWIEATLLTQRVTAGALTIYFSTANLELEVGGVVLLYNSYNSNEVVEISTIASTYITIKYAISGTYTNTSYAVPVRVTQTPDGVQFTRRGGSTVEATIVYRNTSAFYTSTWFNGTTFDSLPVITQKTVFQGTLSEKILRKISDFDGSTGTISELQDETYSRHFQTVSFIAKTRASRYSLRRAIDYLKGRYNAVWLPTFSKDVVITSNILIGHININISYIGWSVMGYSSIQIVMNNGTSYYIKVTGAVNSGGGIETLTITPASSVDILIANIKEVYVLTKIRLDTDRVEFRNYSRTLTTCTIPVTEVPA